MTAGRRSPGTSGGMIAAGHPLTAEVGAEVLREGGSAADAVVAAALASWVCEPLLTGPAAGGHLLAVPPDAPAVAIDAFCAVPGSGAPTRRGTDERRGGGGRGAALEPRDAGRLRSGGAGAGAVAEDPITGLVPVDVDFGDAHQTFHVGGAAVAAFGLFDGLVRLHARWGRLPLADLAAPAARLARDGVPLNRQQAYVATLLEGILRLTPESCRLWLRDDRLLREGERFRSPELGETIERLGREGVAPLRDGDLAAACVTAAQREGGVLTAGDLANYRAIERAPIRVGYRDRTILTAPPSSAGGVLLALALGRLDTIEQAVGAVGDDSTLCDGAADRKNRRPPTTAELIDAMTFADAERTARFDEQLYVDGFAERLLALRLGSTTHLSVIDGDGLACGITATNGEGSGVVVPGTGIHLNNVMGEEDLNPRLRPGGAALPRLPPGRRMPSMMAPTAVLRGDALQAILGSAGSSRIRSALLQTIVGLIDHDRAATEAVEAPRIHVEDGTLYAEPGVELPPTAGSVGPHPTIRFRERNLYFGGVQLVCRDPASGVLTAAGDPRRGGAVAEA